MEIKLTREQRQLLIDAITYSSSPRKNEALQLLFTKDELYDFLRKTTPTANIQYEFAYSERVDKHSLLRYYSTSTKNQ